MAKKQQRVESEVQRPVQTAERNVMATTDERVAQRAFELFLARGGEHGHDVEDWLRAEREVRGAQKQR